MYIYSFKATWRCVLSDSLVQMTNTILYTTRTLLPTLQISADDSPRSVHRCAPSRIQVNTQLEILPRKGTERRRGRRGESRSWWERERERKRRTCNVPETRFRLGILPRGYPLRSATITARIIIDFFIFTSFLVYFITRLCTSRSIVWYSGGGPALSFRKKCRRSLSHLRMIVFKPGESLYLPNFKGDTIRTPSDFYFLR